MLVTSVWSRRACAILTLAGVSAAAVPAAAAPPTDPAALVAAFDRWVAANHIGEASIAVLHRGAVVAQSGHGGRTADDPVRVASLSKAITAVCIAKLVQSGRLSFGDPAMPWLAQMPGYAEPADPRARAITVGQLVTHTSGLPRKLPLRDPESGPSTMAGQLARALAAPLARAPGAGFEYSNMNYAALGRVIEAVTGAPYEAHCRRSVLAPAGVTSARIGMRRAGAYGGWVISAADYGRFLRHFQNDPALRLLPEKAWPAAATPAHARYGLGVVRRQTPAGPVLSHNGAWFTGDPEESIGAVFAILPNGLTVVANYRPNPRGAVRALVQALGAAPAERRS